MFFLVYFCLPSLSPPFRSLLAPLFCCYYFLLFYYIVELSQYNEVQRSSAQYNQVHVVVLKITICGAAVFHVNLNVCYIVYYLRMYCTRFVLGSGLPE